MTATSTAHSAPPDVILEAVGRDRDIALVTLDLEAPAIARSIVLGLARGLSHPANATRLLHQIADTRDTTERDHGIDVVLGHARSRSVFQVDLTHEAAQALHEQLGRVLEQAETECRVDGCSSIATHGDVCAADDERHDRRIGA